MNRIEIRTCDYEQRTTGHVLRMQAEKVPDDVFLMEENARYTFSDVHSLSNRWANWLRGRGVAAGEPVAVLMDNSADFAVMSFAINKAGGFYVPTNTTYRGEWLEDVLNRSRAKIIVLDAGLAAPAAAVVKHTQIGTVVVRGDLSEAAAAFQGTGVDLVAFAELDQAPTDEPTITVDYRELCSVPWTSGTTGKSKGVMLSHNAHLAVNDWMCRNVRMVEPGDVFYCCLPMYNNGGWGLSIYNALVTGLPVAIDREFSVSRFWDRCRHYGATQIATLSTMHVYLWQAPEQPTDRDNPVRVAGMFPMPAGLIGPFKERFGIEHIFQAFGQSEIFMWTATNDPTRAWKPGSNGVVRDDLDVALLDDHDRVVPVGEVGEICIRPKEPYVIFSGYYHDSEGTVRAYRNLWYHSGDLGRFDGDGELFFVDRKADFMRYKGRNVSSFEIEQLVARHVAVAEVAAHGVRAEEMSLEEEVKLCIVRKPEVLVTEQDIAEYIAERAPYWMVPRYVEFYDTLPHTPTGRVQKYLLKQAPLSVKTWDRVAAGFDPRADRERS